MKSLTFNLVILLTTLSLSGCINTQAPVPENIGMTWKVEYSETINDYTIELDTSKSTCQTVFCKYELNVFVLVYHSGLAVPRYQSPVSIYSMDKELPYIGTLKSGKKIKMVTDCGYTFCFDYPSSKEGKEYVYNELINGRDVEIDITRFLGPTEKLFFPTLGFKENIEKLIDFKSKPTPLDLAL